MKTNCQTLIVSFFFLSLSMVTFAQQQVSDAEMTALLDLYRRTGGEEWKNTWQFDKAVSEWYGVKVKDGKVVGLDLSNNNLNGNLPLAIGNLKNLEYLDLSDNNLSGRMPKELRKFNKVKHFDLSGNDFEGKLPKSINRLASVVHLNLESNRFSGELPATITELAAIHSLNLAQNDFSGGIPDGMQKLKKIEELLIGQNNFVNLDGLRSLAKQQYVAIDVNVNRHKFNNLDFSDAKSGMTELKFEDED